MAKGIIKVGLFHLHNELVVCGGGALQAAIEEGGVAYKTLYATPTKFVEMYSTNLVSQAQKLGVKALSFWGLGALNGEVRI